MPRERRGLVRKSGGQSKDPYVMFVIAAEGSDTEILYFRQIKSHLERLQLGRLVKVEPLERPHVMSKTGELEKDTRSNAEVVIDLLNGYQKKYNIKEGDELWCVIDRDRWHPKNIAAAAQRCRQRRYEFSVTTPCFEFWLLLHLRDLSNFSVTDQNRLLANRRDSSGGRTYTEHELNAAMKSHELGAYKKNSLPNIAMQAPNAVRQAFNLALEADHWQEDRFCTRLHLLLQRIFKLNAPDYHLPTL